MTETDVFASWTKADVNKAGSVDETTARQYFAMLRVADKPVSDGKLTKSMFFEHCKAGLFNMSMVDPGAPLTGANSFTESQAQDRIVAAGFTEVSVLVKDKRGHLARHWFAGNRRHESCRRLQGQRCLATITGVAASAFGKGGLVILSDGRQKLH